nr:unnamed protein product [Callosobruchus chinensis]
MCGVYGKGRNITGQLMQICNAALQRILAGYLVQTYLQSFFCVWECRRKQTVHVQLFSDYEEQGIEPVTDIYVEIQTRHIEIYSAKFSVNAQFSGLRYVMYHWPVLSAALGITANLFFIALICLMSWYQIINSEEYLTFIEATKYKKVDSDTAEYEEVSPLVDFGSIGLIPVFMGYDIFSTVATRIAGRFSFLLKIPNAVIQDILAEMQTMAAHERHRDERSLLTSAALSPFNTYNDDSSDGDRYCSDRRHDQDQRTTECHHCKCIVCAKHKKSGCEECLANSNLVFLT